MSSPATVLIVDDDLVNRSLLARQISGLGHRSVSARDGAEALAALAMLQVDLVLLDVMMPRMDGFAVLEQMKRDPQLFWVPVILVSALDDRESITRGLALGADDLLVKPWHLDLLRARLTATLARKAAHDREQAAQLALQREQARANALLHQIFPASVVGRILRDESLIVDAVAEATVIFADMVNFTRLSAELPAGQVVALLNRLFGRFDELAEAAGVETIKTQGDAYVAATGVPAFRPDHAPAAVELARQMQIELRAVRAETGLPLQMRVGLHSGPVVAGTIGRRRRSYDLWGETVNIASRMESHGVADAIQVSAATYAQTCAHFPFTPRGTIEVKGIGPMRTYLLL